jgi:methionyl-tRNA formyltransferase
MGTPEFAIPTLEALAEAHQVVGVVTQPDRTSGRRRQLKESPVKRAALELDLPLFQPQTLRTTEALMRLADWKPKVIVVAAFGQILLQDVLDLPPHGCLNIHASLLPRWRGAAPVAAAILAGDEITGATIMQMDVGLDTGLILKQREEPIRPDDTRATLRGRLSRLGAELLIVILPAYLAGDLPPRSQPEEGITYAGRLRKEDGLLDWTRPAVELDRQLRAFTPWPGVFTFWRGQRLKVLEAKSLPDWRGGSPPGCVVALTDGVVVATGKGALRLEKVQLAGKRAMAIEVFVCGQQDCVGSHLDDEPMTNDG